MKAKSTMMLGLVASTGVKAFHQAAWRPQGQGKTVSQDASAVNPISDVTNKCHAPAAGASRRKKWALHASYADPSAPRKKSNKKKRKNAKHAVEQWAMEVLHGKRFHQSQVYECKATTLPEVLSEFWSVVALYAQKKFSATVEDRDFAAHILFVAAKCDLLKDYGMMRHLDKVIDFCSGGCADFGRTVTLQHYHPDIVLPPAEEDPRSRRHHHAVAAKPSELDSVMNSARSPYPAFGLTVAGGSASRSEPLKPSDKAGRLRLDLEMLYNSVSGCSADDDVDAHGSPHGMIPTSPDEIRETTQRWLTEYAKDDDEFKDVGDGSDETDRRARDRRHHMRVLSSADDFVTTNLCTPEELFSEVWAIVTELQGEVVPALEAEAKRGFQPSSSSSMSTAASENEAVEGEADEQADAGGASSRFCDPLVSTLLVSPRLHPFNSAMFENLARNVDIALKQTPIMDRVEVEVYHPEFVCDGGFIDPIRRSPFPTLLIKHCGLKDELFEPSGMYRHAVPPLKLPADHDSDAADEARGKDQSASDSETATEVSADDAKI